MFTSKRVSSISVTQRLDVCLDTFKERFLERPPIELVDVVSVNQLSHIPHQVIVVLVGVASSLCRDVIVAITAWERVVIGHVRMSRNLLSYLCRELRQS